jgi:hypothetical protein
MDFGRTQRLGLWPGCFSKKRIMLTPLVLDPLDDVVGVGLGERDEPGQLVPAHPLLFGEPHEVADQGELLVAGSPPLRSYSLPWSAVGQLERRSVALR